MKTWRQGCGPSFVNLVLEEASGHFTMGNLARQRVTCESCPLFCHSVNNWRWLPKHFSWVVLGAKGVKPWDNIAGEGPLSAPLKHSSIDITLFLALLLWPYDLLGVSSTCSIKWRVVFLSSCKSDDCLPKKYPGLLPILTRAAWPWSLFRAVPGMLENCYSIRAR